jgi:hypothetical protein
VIVGLPPRPGKMLRSLGAIPRLTGLQPGVHSALLDRV